jgi:hypothetical protein
MGNQPGQEGGDEFGDRKDNTYDDFCKRDQNLTSSSRSRAEKQKKGDKKAGNKSPKSRRNKEAGPSLGMGVDLDDDDLDDFGEEDKEDRSRSDSQTARNPFAAPIKSVAAREKFSQKAAANSDNPFAKPTLNSAAAPAEGNDDNLDDFVGPALGMGSDAPPTQEMAKREKKDKRKDGGSFSKSRSQPSNSKPSKKEEEPEEDVDEGDENVSEEAALKKYEEHELIEQAVQALGGESLWVCISKRGVAFRMSTSFEDKENDVDGMEYGDICAVSDLVEGEDGVDFIKLATGAESDITYYIPVEFENDALMVKLTCEDAVHGETTSIFRVDKDDGVNYLSVPVYGTRVQGGLDDNHVLTTRIVMVGESGHRFAFDPWRSLWVPEQTARGVAQLYALNLMKDNVREVYRVQAAQGIAFRGSPRFHEKLPGDDGLDKGDVVAVCALMKSMSRPHHVEFALVANSVRWVPLTSIDGVELMKKIDCERSEFVFQVKEQGATLFSSPDFGEPLGQKHSLEPHKIVTCCAKVPGPTEGIEFYLLTNGTHWVSNEDQNGEVQIERTKMIAHPFMYRCTLRQSEAKYYALPATNQTPVATGIVEEGDLVAARLRVEDNGVLFVLCAKTMTWLPICTIDDDASPGVAYLEPTKVRGTICEFSIEKLGLKDASTGYGYTNPFIQVSLVDRHGDIVEEYETPYATRVNDQHMYFLSTVTLEQPVELVQECGDDAIYFEFKHYKKDKHMVSTKCYSFMTTRELRNYFEEAQKGDEECVPLRMHIYKSEKPTDYARKWPPVRLSVKELYMHVTLSFKKYQKKSKK